MTFSKFSPARLFVIRLVEFLTTVAHSLGLYVVRNKLNVVLNKVDGTDAINAYFSVHIEPKLSGYGYDGYGDCCDYDTAHEVCCMECLAGPCCTPDRTVEQLRSCAWYTNNS